MVLARTPGATLALLVTVSVLMLGAAGQAAADSIALMWDPSASSVGYKVHVGAQPGAYTQHFDVGSATDFTYTNAVAGQPYCFVVSAYDLSSLLEGPNSAEVCGYSNASPTLANPGSRSSTTGEAVTLQLVGSDPESQPLTYGATGLPPGLTLMANTGFISGAGTTAGTYSVTARASDGTLTASQTFTWTITAATASTPIELLSLTMNKPSPQPVGTPITFTAAVSGGTAPYQFKWTLFNGVSWNMVQQWSTSSSFTWTPTAAGSGYQMAVWVRSAGNTVEAPEASGSIAFAIAAAPATDTTSPTASISTPTTGTSYSTTSSSINVSGTAADNAGVTQVRWASDRGGSGVASGTTSWSVSGISLVSGTNVITITAFDAAGNQGTDSLTVTYSTADTTQPIPTISAPTTGTTYAATSSTIGLSGTAADNVGVAQVRWTSDRGGSGVASGTTNWSALGIPLLGGTNVITITAVDAAGNQGADTLTVTYTVTTTTPTVALTAQPKSNKRWRSTRLSWSNAPWSSVDVYRNGMLITNTQNDGAYTDPIFSGGTYVYQICLVGSTTVCSNTATVYY
jgi:hypothetical protein